MTRSIGTDNPEPVDNNSGDKNKTNPSEPPQNSLATWAFFLSLIAVFGIGLAGYAGLIMGITALNQIKEKKEQGYGLAIAAIVVGAIWGPILGLIRLLVEAGY